MLYITIPSDEIFDEATSKFITIPETKLQLEHSLVSVSKWEAKWHKIFLDSDNQKTDEETLDYIRCMTLTQNVDPNVYYGLRQKQILKIKEYIDNPMTATTFNEENVKKIFAKASKTNEKTSSETLYYEMIALNIPFECQKWHLNRLITLIKICTIKNQPPKKMSKSELASKYRDVNAARRAAAKANK